MFDDVAIFPDEAEVVESGRGADGLAGVTGMEGILMSGNPLQELRKALTAGYGTDPAGQTGGGAFRIESLESTLKVLTFNEQSTTLANDLLKDKKVAESTVEEYSTLDDISEAFTYAEAGLPAQEDDSYSRKYELVKYIGAVGTVSNVILRTKNIVSAREAEVKRKMLAMKRKLNLVSYFGNASLVTTEFNGFLTAVQNANLPDNIVDLRGKRPTLENFNQGVNVIEDVAGHAFNLRVYMSTRAARNYKNELLKDKRYLVGEMKAEVEGLKAGRIVHDDGEMPIKKDIFLNPRKHPRMNLAKTTFIATGDKAPLTPTVTSVVVGADATSQIDAGTYDYAVVAINQYGHKSAPIATGDLLAVAVTSAEKVTFDIADGGSASGQEATAFELYRRTAGGANTDYEYVWTFAAGATFVDNGAYLPGTGCMFLMEWDTDQVAAYHQLLDASIFPLGAVADAVRWLQRLYGTLLVYNAKKIVVFKNVGDTPNA